MVKKRTESILLTRSGSKADLIQIHTGQIRPFVPWRQSAELNKLTLELLQVATVCSSDLFCAVFPPCLSSHHFFFFLRWVYVVLLAHSPLGLRGPSGPFVRKTTWKRGRVADAAGNRPSAEWATWRR